MKSISQNEATEQGYRPLTIPYLLPEEQWMLDVVEKDMRGQDAVYVTTDEGPEVWKKGIVDYED